MNGVWSGISTNILVIKELLGIVFTLIATVIAILTYRRARYTILQPLRSEVIKRQTDLLIDIMTTLPSENSLLSDLDIEKVVDLNTYKQLSIFGFILNDSDKMKEEFRNVICGGMIVKRGNQLESFEKPKTFREDREESMDSNADDFGKKMYGDLKQGTIDIEVIYITKKYEDTMNKYMQFASNAFLPTQIKELLEKVIYNINYDISVCLKETLEETVIEVYKKIKMGKNSRLIQLVFTMILIKKHSNSKLINEIRNQTREYLMIDKKW